jgi:hypothetical protein
MMKAMSVNLAIATQRGFAVSTDMSVWFDNEESQQDGKRREQRRS